MQRFVRISLDTLYLNNDVGGDCGGVLFDDLT